MSWIYFTKIESRLLTIRNICWAILIFSSIILVYSILSLFGQTTTNELSLTNDHIAAAANWALIEFPSSITWQVTAILIVLFIVMSKTARTTLSGLTSRFRTIKAFGAEVEFSEEGARQLSLTIDETFEEYKSQAYSEFRRQSEANKIRTTLESVLKNQEKLVIKGKTNPTLRSEIFSRIASEKIRCTIHVPDLLFADMLYQLIDYYPRGSGAGRRFSVRYGIIGRTWRTAESTGQGKTFNTEGDLVENWGMTEEEAVNAVGSAAKHSLLCALLTEDNGDNLAVIFVDAPGENVFGDDDQAKELAGQLAKICQTLGLTKKLSEMLYEIRKRGTKISTQ